MVLLTNSVKTQDKKMDILQEIVAHKQKEVAKNKELYPVKLLEKSLHFDASRVSLKEYLLRPDKSGIIAEFKRKSPSKGMINEYAMVKEVTTGYMQAGASALSILTDNKYFGGKNEDLTEARDYNFCPILRKDFIVDEYQLVEAKSIGADAILLIAAVLSATEAKTLAKQAKELGLEVLFEIHAEEELGKVNEYLDVVGVNNRNLKTFEVKIQTSLDLSEKIPGEFVKISESGIHDPEKIRLLTKSGFQGFLIGENFMKHSMPGKACQEFIKQL